MVLRHSVAISRLSYECINFIPMNNFVVSARKYRPSVFAHVIGQPHVTTTLKNAIKYNHLAQAFLFCGPRGVGKTTCARILAKTINCQQVTPDTEPCNTCVSCAGFIDNRSFNIHELDAASNNSVEDIRALVEQVRYPPQKGQYKVYIIDEVHMLSNAAFNAFLKTLEEPPSYAVFILATTEKYKIIPTILSRCQIFDFNRIQPQDIVQKLKQIAQQENVTYEEEALYLMGQKADGALRDALSIFDLIVTFASGQSVTLQATRDHLYILDYTYYFRLTDTFLQRNPGAALLIYDEILKAGFDGHHFIVGLSEHFRNLMMSQDTNTLQLLAATDNVKRQYQTQAAQVRPTFLFKALSITNQCSLDYKTSHNDRLHVEVTLIELCHIQEAAQLANDEIKKQPAALPNKPSNISSPPISTPALTPSRERETNRNNEENKLANDASRLSNNKTKTLQSTIKIPQIDQLKKDFNQPIALPSAQPAKPITTQLPIAQEAVHKHWHAYAKKLKLAGKMSEYSLMNQEITFSETTIVVKLISTVQQDILAGIKEDLMAYLRQNLQCQDLKLKDVVVLPEKIIKPYTAQEKFKYLAEKYSDLRTLQEKLSLEVQD
jgi:DNA polymerase III subunit gamma/tau